MRAPTNTQSAAYSAILSEDGALMVGARISDFVLCAQESIIPPDIDTIDLSSDALLEGDGAASAHDSTELPGDLQ